MPQIRLEYSSNINIQFKFSNLFADIHNAVHTIGNSRIENCKSRAILCPEYFIGTGVQNHAFVHLELQWLEGRSQEIKEQLGENMLQILQDYFSDAQHELAIQITTHIMDIPRQFYFKYPKGTFSQLN